jgi:hypothetical protein
LTSRNPGSLDVRVQFYKGADQPEEWVRTDTWHQASAIPDLTVSTITEPELQKFGALTSGQVLLYDSGDNLIFNGGITGIRGHEGDNTGLASIETYLRTGNIPVSTTPVFGCILSVPD